MEEARRRRPESEEKKTMGLTGVGYVSFLAFPPVACGPCSRLTCRDRTWHPGSGPSPG